MAIQIAPKTELCESVLRTMRFGPNNSSKNYQKAVEAWIASDAQNLLAKNQLKSFT